ncbi:MAG: transposase [Spirochaetes bacterium]|nr:transposase [Spirochaetota bacterium]
MTSPTDWVDRNTKEKTYSEMTMDINEPFDFAQGKFMARMLFYSPDKHRKAIRYYGIYAHAIKNKLDRIIRKTWAKTIQSSFDTDPENCPDCGASFHVAGDQTVTFKG